MMRFAPSLAALLLCGSALAGCASDHGDSVMGSLGQHKNVPVSAGDNALPTDVDSGLQQARQARLTGNYDAAIHILSQLMLVASDDPRVVGEYGKTLVEKGRASEAVQFLIRATELQPRDWTFYSALGVAYDETGNQDDARLAYTHALALKPDEPSVLNNYALSRMLANDPAMARQLIASAASAGGASDPKIARNITLVNSLTSVPAAPAPVAANPSPQRSMASASPAQLASRGPSVAPKPIIPAVLPAAPATQPNSQVVMEPVPVDPLAGPVKIRKAAVKPATADDKSVKVESAKNAETEATAIPDLRQAALNY